MNSKSQHQLDPLYVTEFGKLYNSSIEDFIEAAPEAERKFDLILTSPPYPLLSPKAYGNRVGQDYHDWIIQVFGGLIESLSDSGSLVVEIGNAWEKGSPTMSTLPIETLLSLKNQLGLHVCQQMIWQNPSKLPGPANWVNKHRIRVKDSFTYIWWFSKTDWPKADNRKVLQPYKPAMEKLLKTQNYNQGSRPSGHTMGAGFLTRHDGSIPSSVISMANSAESKDYKEWCKLANLPRHPARMPVGLAKFFIEFLTDKGDLVLDPFGGSNTTGFAAQELGREWVSVERDSNYALGSAGRFGLDFAMQLDQRK